MSIDPIRITQHYPVLIDEVLESLNIVPGGCYVDGTLGGAGHAEAILERLGPHGTYLGIDRDLKALERAKVRLKKFSSKILYYHGSYAELEKALDQFKINAVDGVLLDLGISSDQLEDSNRGFSFMKEGPLDMRMNPQSNEPSAADLVNELSEEELIKIFFNFGEERFSRRIAKAILASRNDQPFSTTQQLAALISRVVPYAKKGFRIHPATRCFQALRIAVNQELTQLDSFLKLDFKFLKSGGRVSIISFHSLEDRLVKWAWKSSSLFKLIHRKPIQASALEIQQNPRSRSAKLRTVEKVGET